MARIQFRRDSEANWGTYNPVLADGEIGIETGTKRFKLGDGVTAWDELLYSSKTFVDNPEELLILEDATDMSYDDNGVLLSVTYGNDSKRLFTYDNSLLSKEEITDVDGTTIILTKNFSYDTDGNLISIIKE